MNKNVNMIFGGFANQFDVWVDILNLIENHHYIMRDDVKIRALFDNFGACTWNGGGYNFKKLFTYGEVQRISNYFNDRNIPIRLTMTNPMVEKRDLYDRYANMILSTCESDNNEVLVATDLMEDFIRSAYPKYKICRSIIKSEVEPCDVSNRYEMSVLRRKYNNNFEFLESIPENKRHKVEVLCNESCVEDCPRAYEHYRVHGIEQLNFCPNFHGKNSNCTMTHGRTLFRKHDLLDRYSYISPELIREKYIPLGYSNFKIAGRNNPVTLVEEFARYAIKPEYQEDFRCIILTPFCEVK